MRYPLDLSNPQALREQSASSAFWHWLKDSDKDDLMATVRALDTMIIQMNNEIRGREWREDPRNYRSLA